MVICGRKQDGLDAAAAELDGGEHVLAIPAHIAREADVDRLFDQTTDRFGRVDVLVNNVGMNLFTPSVTETEPAMWQKIIDSKPLISSGAMQTSPTLPFEQNTLYE